MFVYITSTSFLVVLCFCVKRIHFFSGLKCVCDVIRVSDQKIIQQNMAEKEMNPGLKY